MNKCTPLLLNNWLIFGEKIQSRKCKASGLTFLCPCLKIIIGCSVSPTERKMKLSSERQTGPRLNRWTDRWMGRQTSPKYSWTLTPCWHRGKNTHLHLGRERKKSSWSRYSEQKEGLLVTSAVECVVCSASVTHFGWDHCRACVPFCSTDLRGEQTPGRQCG